MVTLQAAWSTDVMKRLEPKVDRMLAQLQGKIPHDTGKNGIYASKTSDYWTSGFWPGILWIMYEMTGKESYKNAAWPWDEELGQWFARPTEELHHDVGFQFLSTAVIKYKLTGDADARRRGIAAANFLAARFNPVGNYIRAWNGDLAGWSIIDCMLNISILFWAGEETGDPRYKHIAVKHAETTMKYGVREDGSTNHILSFNPETGDFIESIGGQGLSPSSTWTRGNAWALYGFANTYRHTGDERFLTVAKRVAHYFIAALPDDFVPFWDFRLEPGEERQYRDSSAGAIAASGLLEISDNVPSGEKPLYAAAAGRILKSLTDNYGTWDEPEHEAILKRATGSGNSFIETSLIFGDYYYVEAIAKLNGWKNRIY